MFDRNSPGKFTRILFGSSRNTCTERPPAYDSIQFTLDDRIIIQDRDIVRYITCSSTRVL